MKYLKKRARLVDSLPILTSENFPYLPSLKTGEELVSINERCFFRFTVDAVKVLITCCSKAGKWRIVSSNEFGSLINQIPGLFIKKQRITRSLVHLVIDGAIEIIQVEGRLYIVPLKRLGNLMVPSGRYTTRQFKGMRGEWAEGAVLDIY